MRSRQSSACARIHHHHAAGDQLIDLFGVADPGFGVGQRGKRLGLPADIGVELSQSLRRSDVDPVAGVAFPGEGGGGMAASRRAQLHHGAGGNGAKQPGKNADAGVGGSVGPAAAGTT